MTDSALLSSVILFSYLQPIPSLSIRIFLLCAFLCCYVLVCTCNHALLYLPLYYTMAHGFKTVMVYCASSCFDGRKAEGRRHGGGGRWRELRYLLYPSLIPSHGLCRAFIPRDRRATSRGDNAVFVPARAPHCAVTSLCLCV